jgi:ATP-dependent DNA helicase DinG
MTSSNASIPDSARGHQAATATIALPDIPALCVNSREAALMSTEGEIKTLSHDAARMLLHKKPVMLCHTPFTLARLGLQECAAFDVLELYAFVHPAQFCVPTPAGLCKALGLNPPQDLEDAPFALADIARALLQDLQADPLKAKADPLKIAGLMGLQGKGWCWTPYIYIALGQPYDSTAEVFGKSALNVWRNLPEWAEEAPPPPAGHEGVSAQEAAERLQVLLGYEAETRNEQRFYAESMAEVFAPVTEEQEPHIVLAEAGTGIGKTLGYLSPASVWAEKNKGAVWISTYTKALQRQIDQELNRLYPEPALKETHVAIRKGRENYLCLLNFEDAANGAALARYPDHAIATGLMARWIAASKDGDLSGADFPGWLPGLLGYAHTTGLADRRGECVYSACDHYSRCFVEHSVRKTKHARLVIANHALVMISAALSQPGDDMPTRMIFDEGHHLFHAADSAYSAHLTGRETRDLRRWILGAEGGKQSRARGLKKRLEDLLEGDDKAMKMAHAILHEAQGLTAEGWSKRLKNDEKGGTGNTGNTGNAGHSGPSGPAEEFLALIYKQVIARNNDKDSLYSIETPVHPVHPDIIPKAQALRGMLRALQKPMQQLIRHLQDKLAQDNGEMDSDTRKRMDAVAQSLYRRSTITLGSWIKMLEDLETGAAGVAGVTDSAATGGQDFVDWLEIERIDGKAYDVGYFRHWVDPMKPFSLSIRPHAHGIGITSASLRDSSGHDEEDWRAASAMTGMDYMAGQVNRITLASPFDYAAQTKIFIINDVRRDDIGQIAGAYRSLFEASQGGALGVFTAIQRLRAVHNKIAAKLEDKGLALYSQHVDQIDSGSLVDMFREDIHACLLGTDAVRDGVDVPGESLRLLVFDRVPWPRPTILHKARREAFGGRNYDELITRMKLKQAYGRLIRRRTDKGVFVMLDNMFPSRLHNAFPPDVEIVKCGLAEAREAIAEFLKNYP